MTVPCPTCRTPAAWKDNPWRPFCSERCRLLDLGSWLREEYRVAAEDDEDGEHGEDETGSRS